MGQVGRWLARGRSEDGAQLVEFALVLPLLLLVVLGIAEFGFAFQRYEVLSNAAREGARLAVLPGYADADVQARVAAFLSSGRVPATQTNPSVTVQNVSIPMTGGRPPISAKRVTVTYTYTFQFLNALRAFFGSKYPFPITAISEMRTEAGS